LAFDDVVGGLVPSWFTRWRTMTAALDSQGVAMCRRLISSWGCDDRSFCCWSHLNRASFVMALQNSVETTKQLDSFECLWCHLSDNGHN